MSDLQSKTERAEAAEAKLAEAQACSSALERERDEARERSRVFERELAAARERERVLTQLHDDHCSMGCGIAALRTSPEVQHFNRDGSEMDAWDRAALRSSEEPAAKPYRVTVSTPQGVGTKVLYDSLPLGHEFDRAWPESRDHTPCYYDIGGKMCGQPASAHKPEELKQ